MLKMCVLISPIVKLLPSTAWPGSTRQDTSVVESLAKIATNYPYQVGRVAARSGLK